MNTKLLTVVVPVRNRARLIVRLLDCIATELEVTDFNAIIVDNGSTDSTLATITDWLGKNTKAARSVTLLTEPVAGACAARNRGLRETSTPYIMFFDSDDYFEKGHIRRINDYLGNAIAQGNAPQIVRWSQKLAAAHKKSRLSGTPAQVTLLNHLYHSTLSTLRFCASTQLVRRVGGWNNNLKVWNDLEFSFRLLLESPDIHLLAGNAMVVVDLQAESITGLNWSGAWADRLLALDTIEADALGAGRPDLAFAVDCRRMLLAATIAREGATGAARSIVEKVSRTGSTWRLARLKIVYGVQRLFGRGGTFIATLFS